MDTTSGPALMLDGVSKRYGKVQALERVSLEVERGEFFGVLGPNGAGKTTLVEIMEGLRIADSGEISVLGRKPWPRNPALLPRIGAQTQKAAFFPRLTAREHLVTVAGLFGCEAAAADEALSLVGLESKAEERVEDLSGGQRQRLAIASALVHGPELVFLDEPTAALDPQARRALWETLRTLKAMGRTIVYTTHHLDEAEALCDRVAIVVDGSVVALGAPHALVREHSGTTSLLVPAERLSVERAQAIAGVEEVTVEGGAVVLRTRSTGPVLEAIGEIAGLDGIRTRSTTLEDVYLQLTGTRNAS
ncbi:ABC transporter ATP-binding protein [Streptomyces rubiginosohelvolus]|uniref:ABC transporter ATP-binding protein n=1 Tax=Streptomyces rubiginosohelvolus TaxID=67362 RepID=UPI00343F56FC